MPAYSSFFATHGPINTTFASGMRRFISIACATMGDTVGARNLRSSGKCFSTSKFAEWQTEDMMISCVPSLICRSYSRLTIVAPMAVSSASAKPRAFKALRMEFMPQLSQTAKNDGETLAITGAPLSMSARTVPLSSTISFASCGHTTKHWPQRMHWSLMICA